jgi:hypothetical protein
MILVYEGFERGAKIYGIAHGDAVTILRAGTSSATERPLTHEEEVYGELCGAFIKLQAENAALKEKIEVIEGELTSAYMTGQSSNTEELRKVKAERKEMQDNFEIAYKELEFERKRADDLEAKLKEFV